MKFTRKLSDAEKETCFRELLDASFEEASIDLPAEDKRKLITDLLDAKWLEIGLNSKKQNILDKYGIKFGSDDFPALWKMISVFKQHVNYDETINRNYIVHACFNLAKYFTNLGETLKLVYSDYYKNSDVC